MKRYTEFSYILNGYTPDTIPMRRLAEYMLQISKLFGNEETIRFDRIEKGSVALINRVPAARAGKITRRIRALNRGEGAYDALVANNYLNQMLYEDGINARIKAGSATILRFPGTSTKAVLETLISGPVSLTGYFYSLSENSNGQVKAKLRVTLKNNKTRAVDIICDNTFADTFKKQMFNVVRVTGIADWMRTEEGEWHPENIKVYKSVEINTSSLQIAVNQVRSLDVRWTETPIKLQKEIDKDD